MHGSSKVVSACMVKFERDLNSQKADVRKDLELKIAYDLESVDADDAGVDDAVVFRLSTRASCEALRSWMLCCCSELELEL